MCLIQYLPCSLKFYYAILVEEHTIGKLQDSIQNIMENLAAAAQSMDRIHQH